MIADRPQYLLAQRDYKGLPTRSFSVDMSSIPDRIRTSLVQLGGIQPVTGAMAEAAGDMLHDRPSAGEVELHRKLGTQFQNIFVVMNLAHLTEENGQLTGTPYSISLIPASKRGGVTEVGIDLVDKIDMPAFLKTEPCYTAYDPFTGDWSMFGQLGSFLASGKLKGFVDELGLVVDQYYLATTYDADDVLSVSGGFTSAEADAKYNKHRNKRLFRPFSEARVRPVWGAGSPIELFLLQGLLRRRLSPILQMILCDDGTAHPSLYHLWRDAKLGDLPGQITEADMYFPERRLAVFCDSNKHHSRVRDVEKDQAINGRLEQAGFKFVRVRGPEILKDLATAVQSVEAALK